MVLYTTSQYDPRSVFKLFNNIIATSRKQKTRISFPRTTWKSSAISFYHSAGAWITNPVTVAAPITWEWDNWIRHSLDFNLGLSQLTRGCTGRWRQWILLCGTKAPLRKPKYFCRKLYSLSRAPFCRKTFCQKILIICMYESGWFLYLSMHESIHWIQQFVILFNLSISGLLQPYYCILAIPGWNTILTTLMDGRRALLFLFHR